MLSVPSIPTERSELSWQLEPEGDLYYYVKGPGGQTARLNPGMLVIALCANGERDLRAIYDAVRRDGFSLDDPAVVVLTFRRLEQIGAVEMRWHFKSLGPIRHTCVGCGRSCEGHVIGPLSDGEVKRLVRLKSELEDAGVPIEKGDPVLLFQTDTGPQPALNTRSGRCIFLDADARCLLHSHFGPTAKPLKCQLFPFRVIETEDGFRVGISSRCAMAHQTYRTSPPTSPREELDARGLRRPPGDLVSLNPASPRSLRSTRAALSNQHTEEFLLTVLSMPDTPLSDVIVSAGGEHRPGSSIPDDYLDAVTALLRRFAGRYQCDPLNQPGTAFGDGVRDFLAALQALPRSQPYVEPPPVVADYLRHALRQYVFLRETMPFGSVELGFQVAIIGVLGALWAANPVVDDEGAVGDQLGEFLSYWLRLHNGGRAMRSLFDTPDELAELGRRLAGRT